MIENSNVTTSLDDLDDGETLAERAAGLVQRDILAGRLLPGARLAVHDLARSYAIGATPIREALSRLVARGLIYSVGRRGFRVADISRNDLEDITRLRVLIEREALRLSMLRGDDAWESEVLGSLHMLRRHVAQHKKNFAEGSDEFDQRHKGFHSAILSACASPRMLEAASSLYDQAYRYRRLMMPRLTGPDHFLMEHQKLADVVLRRDIVAASTLLEAHLRSTINTIYPEGQQ